MFQSPSTRDDDLLRRLTFGLALALGWWGACALKAHGWHDWKAWGLVAVSLACLRRTFTRRRTENPIITASSRRILAALTVCMLPGLALILVLWERPAWHGPLVLFWMLSTSVGPFVLLRRFMRDDPQA